MRIIIQEDCEGSAKLTAKLESLEQLIMKQSEVLAELIALAQQTNKVNAEITGKLAGMSEQIATLEGLLTDAPVSDEMVAVVAGLKSSLQAIDDIVPDPVVVPPTPPEGEPVTPDLPPEPDPTPTEPAPGS